MPQIILKDRTAHLASYTFFTRDVDQYKNASLSQLHQEHLFHRKPITVEQLFYRKTPEAVVCGCPSQQVKTYH